ncbi:probable WRKY transcription factor 32 isoform X2 [Durio zibethinus]|uniref:Probable WRKY transcription factor 32 isoform X2 n=1 Tax=Durio zibethinus TaxID=66656 RepID=A0A6P5XUW5_DURZI|nr:probable WRKY transcription factor 32 isoform X2 [Durio zibethinus]
MAETESQTQQTKRHEEQRNDDLEGEEEEEEEEEEDEDEVEEEEEEEEEGVSRVRESRGAGMAPLTDAKLRESQLETLTNYDRCEGLQENSTSESKEGAELQEQVEIAHPEVLPSSAVQGAEVPTQNPLQSSVSPTSLPQLSPTSFTQESNQQKPSNLRTVSVVPIVKKPISDGYNWRKYGQKQVKSPKGSRSYYKCTFSDCRAKKIECSDHTGHVIEIVNKGMHSHEPPWKNNFPRESKIVSSAVPVSRNIITEHPIRIPNDSDPSTSSKESVPETTVNPERKRQCSSGSDGNGDVQVKEELLSEPEPKKRMKKGDAVCSGSVLKTGKKPKFVVHAAGDVGISGDGYRWRKYGQKMVKGNPNPRNYYRCTSAGCPVRKHIETAVDNTNAVIITYKGVHDHDMPVPKKRHGPPSAPLVAAAAPASMNNLQHKKTDGVQNQVTSTQWSVGTEGELTGEALDLGGEKAMESARTLLSIGFEIKPC